MSFALKIPQKFLSIFKNSVPNSSFLSNLKKRQRDRKTIFFLVQWSAFLFHFLFHHKSKFNFVLNVYIYDDDKCLDLISRKYKYSFLLKIFDFFLIFYHAVFIFLKQYVTKRWPTVYLINIL